MRYISIITLLFITILPIPAAEAVTLQDSSPYYALSKDIDYLLDPSRQLNIDDILNHRYDTPFRNNGSEPFRQPFTTAPYWLRLKLDFSANTYTKRWVLLSLLPNYKDITLYQPQADGNYRATRIGDTFPYHDRQIDSTRYAFYVDPAIKQQTLYLKIDQQFNNNLPFFIIQEDHFISGHALSRNIYIGL